MKNLLLWQISRNLLVSAWPNRTVRWHPFLNRISCKEVFSRLLCCGCFLRSENLSSTSPNRTVSWHRFLNRISCKEVFLRLLCCGCFLRSENLSSTSPNRTVSWHRFLNRISCKEVFSRLLCGGCFLLWRVVSAMFSFCAHGTRGSNASLMQSTVVKWVSVVIALKGVENIVRVGKRQGGVLKFCVQGPGKLFFFQGLVGRERFFFPRGPGVAIFLPRPTRTRWHGDVDSKDRLLFGKSLKGKWWPCSYFLSSTWVDTSM